MSNKGILNSVVYVDAVKGTIKKYWANVVVDIYSRLHVGYYQEADDDFHMFAVVWYKTSD